MMSKVIAFPGPKPRRNHSVPAEAGPVTLFVHVKRTTLIAHLTGRYPVAAAKNGRLSKR